MSERSERMIQSVPGYYHYSRVFAQIQETKASEYDSIDAKNLDIRNQLYITTATWGLKYWEMELRIPVKEDDGYPIRRSRVLSRWRSITSQFSALLIQNICRAFTNGETNVSIDIPAGNIIVTFVGTAGIPTNLDDLKFAVENIVHAHLGTEYKFMYTTWDQTEAQGLNFNTLGTYNWNTLETVFALT